LATGKVIRALCAQGLVEGDGHRYRVVEALRPFFAPGPGDFTPFLDHLHLMYESWGENLEPWLRGEGWGTMPRTPEGIRRFGAAMRAMGARIARRVAETTDRKFLSSTSKVQRPFPPRASVPRLRKILD
jgi:hypothetical protein